MFNLMERFGVSPDRGFLSYEEPCFQLPEHNISGHSLELNKELNQLINNMPALLKQKELKNRIDSLNSKYQNQTVVLDKKNTNQKQTAILILLMLSQGYIQENNKTVTANVIPIVLGKSIHKLCKHRYPTITYADYVLNNWRLKNPSIPIDLNNIVPLFTFTGTPDEDWFIKIHLVIEAVASKALLSTYQSYILAEKGINTKLTSSEHTELLNHFNNIYQSLSQAITTMRQMKKGCDPDYFWNTLRGFFTGWSGVNFTGINNYRYEYRGMSGAQSSIIPALDAAFGIKHELDGMYHTLLSFEEYMPYKNRLFIGFLKSSNIRSVIKNSSSEELKEAFSKVILAIEVFRAAHITLVQEFIYEPAKRQGLSSEELSGSGNTPISEFLNKRFESTIKHKTRFFRSSQQELKEEDVENNESNNRILKKFNSKL